MKRALPALALLLLAFCGGPEAPPPAPGTPKQSVIVPPPSDEIERASVVNLGSGSTVVARTGEVVLETSAIGAIDGDPSTSWQTPAKDFPQSLVIALPARTHVERVGVRNSKVLGAVKVVFEASTDGKTFAPLASGAPQANQEPQWFETTPADATVLRVTIPMSGPEEQGARIASVLVRGRELEAPHPGAIDGCWTVNGRAAAFRSQGAHAAGTMTYARSTMALEGGSDGRIYRFEWINGAEWGYAVFTVSPDGKHLNGIQWHEEPIPVFFGDAWFGERCGVTPSVSEGSPADREGIPRSARNDTGVAGQMLQRAGRHSLYDLRFSPEGKLDAVASAEGLASLGKLLLDYPGGRLVAHEFREKTPAENRTRAQRELDSLREHLQNVRIDLSRVTFVAAGSDQARQIPGSEAARELYSTVDFEARR